MTGAVNASTLRGQKCSEQDLVQKNLGFEWGQPGGGKAQIICPGRTTTVSAGPIETAEEAKQEAS
jgi:hypothetical protein